MNDAAFYRELKQLKNLGVARESDTPRTELAVAYRDIMLCMEEICDRDTVEGLGEWVPAPVGKGYGAEYFRKALDRIAKGDKPDDIDMMVRKFYYYHYQKMSPLERYLFLMYYQGLDIIADFRDMKEKGYSNTPSEWTAKMVVSNLVSWKEHSLGEDMISKFYKKIADKEVKEGLEKIDELCADDDTPLDQNDHTLANEVSLVTDRLSDKDLSLLINNISDCYQLRMMKMLRGRTRRKLLMNMEERDRGHIAYNLYHGIDPDDYATDGAGGSCVIFLETYIHLRKKGDILRKDENGNEIPVESESAYVVATVYKDAHKTKLTVWEEMKSEEKNTISHTEHKMFI